jgi:hypothetical protein
MADLGVRRGFVGLQSLLHLGSGRRVEVLAHRLTFGVGKHDPGGIGGDDTPLHLRGGSADQTVERRPLFQRLSIQVGGDGERARQGRRFLLGARDLEGSERAARSARQHRDDQVGEGQDESAANLRGSLGRRYVASFAATSSADANRTDAADGDDV